MIKCYNTWTDSWTKISREELIKSLVELTTMSRDEINQKLKISSSVNPIKVFENEYWEEKNDN